MTRLLTRCPNAIGFTALMAILLAGRTSPLTIKKVTMGREQSTHFRRQLRVLVVGHRFLYLTGQTQMESGVYMWWTMKAPSTPAISQEAGRSPFRPTTAMDLRRRRWQHLHLPQGQRISGLMLRAFFPFLLLLPSR